MQTCTGENRYSFLPYAENDRRVLYGRRSGWKTGARRSCGRVRRQRGCGGAADHGRRAEAGRAVSRRADVRRRYRGAGPASAHADGAARQHARRCSPRRSRRGSTALWPSGSRRRRTPRTSCFTATAPSSFPAWARRFASRRRPIPAAAVRAGIGKHGQGREGRLYRDHAHQHEPPAPPSALGAAALRAEDRGASQPDGRHGLLPCGPDGSRRSSGAWSSGWRRSTSTGC